MRRCFMEAVGQNLLPGQMGSRPGQMAALVLVAACAVLGLGQALQGQTVAPVAATAPPTSTPATLAAAHGATLIDPAVDLLDDRVQGFFDNLAKEDVAVSVVLDDLLAGGPLADSPDRLTLIESIGQFDERYGKFVEAELIAANDVGEDVLVMHYLYKGRSFPVVWHFTFYRDFQRLSGAEGFDRWVVIGVRFDTDLEALESRDRLR